MPFRDLVEEAKSNTPKPIKRRGSEMKNFIDCTGAHAEHVDEESKCNWTECKFLKKNGTKNFCTEYLCYCSEEKCNKPRK